MPRPVDNYTTYLPGLDGVRTLAVALVILFHLGIGRFQGGLLGVGVFFTLSGYLITSLLIGGWRSRGTLGLKRFWLRRARRLLPAVVVLLITCMVVVLITDPAAVGKRAVEALAALFYVANWHTISAGDSYFTQIHGPGPFDHLWSLSVEEQFYLLWPLLLALFLTIFRSRMKAVAAATAVLAAGSFILLALLAHPSVDNTRAYEGTDARAGGLLVGACLALLWLPGRQGRGDARPLPTNRIVLLDAFGIAGLIGIGWLVKNTNEDTYSLYRWGLLLLTFSALALLAAASHPETLLGKAFGILPLRWLGERSYGIYLWHLPVIVFTPNTVLASQTVLRDLIQVAVTVLLAALSWYFIEDPIRSLGLLGALRAAKGATAQRSDTPPAARRTPRLVVGASVFLPIAVLAMLLPYVLPKEQRSDLVAMPPPPPPAIGSGPSASPRVPSPTTAPTVSRRTRCKSVIEIGDSTSLGLYGSESALSPADNIKGQLKVVGVRTFISAVSGARSIIESYEGQASGEQVIEKHIRAGYRGCWIIALGNIDAATVAKYAPATTSIDERIQTVMRTIPKNQPVMWMTTRTLLTDGDFRESVYPQWNDGLVKACPKYPNMRVYDWASAYQTPWFGPDGIHATTAGYRHKAHLIAHALASAFPAAGASSSCLVSVQ
ncbi:MAG: acyltransferase family protein [Nocardioidaceae bacterium]